MTALDYLRARVSAVGDEPSDEFLESCINDAESFVMEYCGLTEVPVNLSGMVKTLALRSYNTRGVEGFSSYKQGGESLSIKDISKSEQARLNRHRRVIVGGS